MQKKEQKEKMNGWKRPNIGWEHSGHIRLKSISSCRSVECDIGTDVRSDRFLSHTLFAWWQSVRVWKSLPLSPCIHRVKNNIFLLDWPNRKREEIGIALGRGLGPPRLSLQKPEIETDWNDMIAWGSFRLFKRQKVRLTCHGREPIKYL